MGALCEILGTVIALSVRATDGIGTQRSMRMSGEWIRRMDDGGQTPLDRAFNSGHMAVADMMLHQEKADQSEALGGCSPLHRAAYLGLDEAVRSLVSFGSDPEAVDQQGETALHKAARQGHLRTVEVLAPLCDVNAINNHGMTAVHWAAMTGRDDVAQALLTHGGDPFLRDKSLDDLNAVDLASIMGYGDLKATLAHQKACA